MTDDWPNDKQLILQKKLQLFRAKQQRLQTKQQNFRAKQQLSTDKTTEF